VSAGLALSTNSITSSHFFFGLSLLERAVPTPPVYTLVSYFVLPASALTFLTILTSALILSAHRRLGRPPCSVSVSSRSLFSKRSAALHDTDNVGFSKQSFRLFVCPSFESVVFSVRKFPEAFPSEKRQTRRRPS